LVLLQRYLDIILVKNRVTSTDDSCGPFCCFPCLA